MTLTDFITSLPVQLVLKAGEISAAFSNMKFCQNKVKVTNAAYETSVKESSQFNIIDDLGESYMEFVNKTERAAALSSQVSAEKFFKLKCHEFVEAGGSKEQVEQLKAILRERHQQESA